MQESVAIQLGRRVYAYPAGVVPGILGQHVIQFHRKFQSYDRFQHPQPTANMHPAAAGRKRGAQSAATQAESLQSRVRCHCERNEAISSPISAIASLRS